MRMENCLIRENGSQIKIVAIGNVCPLYGFQSSIFVMHRITHKCDWNYIYSKYFSIVSISEVLKANLSLYNSMLVN